MNYDDNQYQTTSYGAQGGTTGGGFLNSSQDFGGVPAETIVLQYGKDTLRPVTIRQVVEAQQPHPDADFKIDGVDIAQVPHPKNQKDQTQSVNQRLTRLASQITFIGQIRNISNQATNSTYKLDDGTSIIEVREYIDTERANALSEQSGEAKLVEGVYVRVWGQLKSFGNKRTVKANMVRKIKDFNEIQYHLLEATAVHLYFARGPADELGKQQEQEQGGMANGQGAGAGDGMTGVQQGQGGAKQLPPMSANARRVYSALLESPQTNEGLHIHNVAAQLGLSVPDATKAGDELLGIGMVYTTVDEETFCVMEA
ncbi:MAG: hypothetical protein M4579_006156 [Chaenotheca gracillima]|nr:MAG: hypothetical protein M4579_006156 [Chaenotheca gracillima]